MNKQEDYLTTALKGFGWIIDQILELLFQLAKVGISSVLGVAILTFLAGAFLGVW